MPLLKKISTATTWGTMDCHPEEYRLCYHTKFMVIRDYVVAIFMDVFGNSAGTPANYPQTIEKWVTFKGAQFGGGCNYYGSYSGI